MAAIQLREFLEAGNIKNSVNYPACEKAFAGEKRMTVMYKEGFVFKDFTGDIESRVKNGYGYAIIDADAASINNMAERFKGSAGVIRVRVLDRPGA